MFTDAIRILLVDDEPDIVSVLQRGLQNRGFAVDAFTDPELALAQFKPEFYDYIITDIKMPKINGFELYREIRQRDDKIKVVFLTAFDILEHEAKLAFPKINSKSFMKKPIGIDDLVKNMMQETSWS